MSIHKTGSNTYEVRWREKGRQRAKTFKRKVDAERHQATVRLKDVSGNSETASKTNRIACLTFSQLSEIWLRDHAEVHKTASSIIRDRQVLRTYLLPHIGAAKLPDICRRDIIELQGKLHRSGKIGPKTINNVLGLCHKIFDDGICWDYCKSNPVRGVKRIKCQDGEHRFWTFHERDRFLTFTKSRHPDLHDLVAFAVHTGLRRGEVEGLLRDCVDFERKEIIVKRNYCHKTNQLNDYTKGKRMRRVPMNSAVFDILKSSMLKRPNQRIFEFDFQHIVPRYLKPLAREEGVSVITFHDLRHTFASHLAMSNKSVLEIQKVLGHSDIKTTMRYMHLAPDHLQGLTDVLMRPGSRNKAPSHAEVIPLAAIGNS